MKRSRPKFLSKKREEMKPQREDLVRQVLDRDRHHCQAKAAPGPCGGPLDVHELIPRSAWASGYLVMENCLTVCRSHHRWIDNHPAAAHALGLHRYSWERTQ